MTFFMHKPAPVDTVTGPTAAPLFLHTGWRSRGTWIWEALRRDPGAFSLYEPLHEELAALTPDLIATRQSARWASGHGATLPYWQEFAPMLRPGTVGVPGFRMRFTAEHAFARSTDSRPELAAYLRGLLRHPAAQGRVPVLKFCRSMGRVAWMQAAFPEALHIVLLRRPDAQWASARLQMEAMGNPYFVVMPLLVLALNARAPVVVRACQALHLRLPQLQYDIPDRGLRIGVRMAEWLGRGPGVPWLLRRGLWRARAVCTRFVDQLSWPDRYRAFLAHWMACTLSALPTDSLFIDADRLAESPGLRNDMAAQLARCCGLRLHLPVDPARPVRPPPPLGGEEAEAQLAALTLLRTQQASLPAEAFMLAWSALAAGLAGAGVLALP
jgi:hypothetical protein